jgi:hypothetical protein
MLILFTLLQGPAIIPEYGIPTGIAGLVLWFWRQDRKDRAEEKKADAARYEALSQDFRHIVQDNTAAIQRLTDALGTRTVQCPFLGPADSVRA